MAEKRISVQDDGDVTMVQFVDRNILDESSIQQIGEELTGLVDRSPSPKILISFESVEHLTSAALGTLITVHNKVRQKDGQLRLADINPQIYEVFAITKLNKLFQIYESRDAARSSFT